MNDIKIGIEIECILNGKIHNIEIGGYHNGLRVQGLNGWIAESDGSLSDYPKNFEQWGKEIEFVSPVFKSKEEFFQGIKDFRKKLSKNGKYKLLSEVLVFNQTCGSHVHFSIKGFVFGKKVIFEVYPLVRDFFFKKIINSKIKSKKDILTHYFRSYSREVNKENLYESRRNEFNLESEEIGKGIEWRSPNLLNISTWSEFEEFWGIIYESLEYFKEKATNYEKEDSDEVNQDGLRDYLEGTKEINKEKNNVDIQLRKRKRRYSNINIVLNKIEGGNLDVQFEHNY